MAAQQVEELNEVDGWRIDIIVQGYPGNAVRHGGLGWSTIALLRRHGKVVLIDVGSFGQRQAIQDRLKVHGLTPGDVTDVLLTHSPGLYSNPGVPRRFPSCMCGSWRTLRRPAASMPATRSCLASRPVTRPGTRPAI